MSHPNQSDTSWTDERLARAKELRLEGFSFGRVADLLGGVSRNAVIGKLRREGFDGGAKARGSDARPKNKNKCRTRRKPQPKPPAPKSIFGKSSNINAVAVAHAREKRKFDGPIVERAPVETAAVPVRFLDRRMSDGQGNGQCAAILNNGAPISELMVCGGPIPEGSQFEFCEAHAAVFLTGNARRRLAA